MGSDSMPLAPGVPFPPSPHFLTVHLMRRPSPHEPESRIFGDPGSISSTWLLRESCIPIATSRAACLPLGVRLAFSVASAFSLLPPVRAARLDRRRRNRAVRGRSVGASSRSPLGHRSQGVLRSMRGYSKRHSTSSCSDEQISGRSIRARARRSVFAEIHRERRRRLHSTHECRSTCSWNP
jgi:hypothetical protein